MNKQTDNADSVIKNHSMLPPEEDGHDYTPAIDFADSVMLIVICLLVYLAVFM